MAKFIKFKIDNANALTGGLGQRDILLDVSKINALGWKSKMNFNELLIKAIMS